MGLARAALKGAQECYPGQTFDDMFLVNSPVTRICGEPNMGVSLTPAGDSICPTSSSSA